MNLNERLHRTTLFNSAFSQTRESPKYQHKFLPSKSMKLLSIQNPVPPLLIKKPKDD
jgi:hypothetical protein